MLTAISLYSGADNLGDGFIQAGGKIKLCIEKDKDCCETIKLNHPNIEVINGLVSEHLSSLPKADCVIGGPPCPEFSRANINRTMDLCEVNNFREAVKIIKAKHHFMENVQDLFKVHKKRNFLVNCADYGVPQTRIRRIFTDLDLPKPTHSQYPTNTLFETPMKKWVSTGEALGLSGLHYISNSGHNTQNREEITRGIDEPADTITVASTMQLTNYKIKSIKKIRNRVFLKKHPPSELSKPAVTIKTRDRGEHGDSIISDGENFRKITNEELAVLQGFRKDFKFYGGKTSVRKQIGNALPSVISKAFFEQITLETPIPRSNIN